MGMEGISKSQVSRLCAEIDGRVQDFLGRPDGGRLALPVARRHLREGQREAGRIVSVAVTIAVGVNGDGRREVLGMAVGASEAETFWTDFLRGLARRGLRGVKLVISDAHEGLKAAVSQGAAGNLAALPRAFRPQRRCPCREDPAPHRLGLDRHRLCRS